MLVTHGSLQPLTLLENALPGTGRLAITVGNFDGVHRGHRAMLERVKAKATELGLRSCVLTFEPHPRELFTPQAAPARLTRLAIKLAVLREAGVDRVHVARFDRAFAAQSPERFIQDVLVQGLRCAWLLVGRDFRFGAKRAGDFSMLESAAGRAGFQLEAMPEVTNSGERISSSGVRHALQAREKVHVKKRRAQHDCERRNDRVQSRTRAANRAAPNMSSDRSCFAQKPKPGAIPTNLGLASAPRLMNQTRSAMASPEVWSNGYVVLRPQ